jgi:hypothetical protein
MKKFLFPTDFSANARHALDYGYNLARQVEANIIICNAVIEPAEIPQAGWVAWPVEESDLLFNGGNDELNLLKRYLKKKEELTGFNPHSAALNKPAQWRMLPTALLMNRKSDSLSSELMKPEP